MTIMTITTYKFRYMNDVDTVYTVTTRKPQIVQPLYSRNTAFLTQPFYIPQLKTERSVVIGFRTSSILEYRLPSILEIQRDITPILEMEDVFEEVQEEMQVTMTKLGDLKLHSELLSFYNGNKEGKNRNL